MLNLQRISKFREEILSRTDLAIVEGVHDKKQLQKFGWESVFDISGKPLDAVAEQVRELNPDSIVILTDFDSEGEEKAKILSQIFNSYSLPVDNFTRHLFKSLLKISAVEEIAHITKFLDDKTVAVNYKIFNRNKILRKRIHRKLK